MLRLTPSRTRFPCTTLFRARWAPIRRGACATACGTPATGPPRGRTPLRLQSAVSANAAVRLEEHTSELQAPVQFDFRLLVEKKNADKLLSVDVGAFNPLLGK